MRVRYKHPHIKPQGVRVYLPFEANYHRSSWTNAKFVQVTGDGADLPDGDAMKLLAKDPGNFELMDAPKPEAGLELDADVKRGPGRPKKVG